jgi:hypothetical protein
MRLLAHNSIFSLNITIIGCIDKVIVCVASSSNVKTDFQRSYSEEIEQNYSVRFDCVFDSFVNRSSGDG